MEHNMVLKLMRVREGATVSYTHLDVYKRQARGSSCNSFFVLHVLCVKNTPDFYYMHKIKCVLLKKQGYVTTNS